jgi:phosphoribosylamine--glycine ligase
VKLLIVGGGGREHALAWRLARGRRAPSLLAAPGNPGIAEHARCVPVAASDLAGIVKLAVDERVELVVVGPEAPLVAGLADRLAEAAVPVLGPGAGAARLEGSKAFAKKFMRERGIPTAEAVVFNDPEAASAHVRKVGAPIAVKADGLAAGKGVVVAQTESEALAAIDHLMRGEAYGAAGSQVLLERFMEGEEVSVFVLAQGDRYVLLPSAQDHKRLGDGDTGPNTGGMGATAPAIVLDSSLRDRVIESIIEPTLAGLCELGAPYVGFLYFGLMIESGVPRVVEYNVRLGDPEAQVVLPLAGSGLAELMVACAHGELPTEVPAPDGVEAGAAACVVLAAPGYPVAPEVGAPIRGLPLGDDDEVIVFHAGTKRQGEELTTAGGRVLGVTGLGADLAGALARAYRAADAIEFEGKQLRRDIGRQSLARWGAIGREMASGTGHQRGGS